MQVLLRGHLDLQVDLVAAHPGAVDVVSIQHARQRAPAGAAGPLLRRPGDGPDVPAETGGKHQLELAIGQSSPATLLD